MSDGKDQVVEHLYNCDGTEDFSAMILLSVMRKLEIIWTTTTTLMIPPVLSVPRFSKERLELLNLWR